MSVKFSSTLSVQDDIKFQDHQLLEHIAKIIALGNFTPIYRLSVLNVDETVDVVIPEEHIVKDSIDYSENYVSGQRRSLSFKLINIKQANSNFNYYNYKKKDYHYPYIPNVDFLWYGKKIKYECGFIFNGKEHLLDKGIFLIKNFSLHHSNTSREISYTCTDKFGLFDGNTGILNEGYEIPVGTPVDEAINGILNLSNTDGQINDIKDCIIDSKYINFKTQSTIRVEQGAKISQLFAELATQMSAEYYYNVVGNLTFYPLNESMNDIQKSIIWTYDEQYIDSLDLSSEDEIINVVKVSGTNVDGKIYTSTVKNDNLGSPINIYRIKERRAEPIDNPNIWSDESAEEYANYTLRKSSILTLKQSIQVVFNPLLTVNNLLEIENEDLLMKREQYIINNINFNSGSGMMSVEIANLSNLPIIGGINYG